LIEINLLPGSAKRTKRRVPKVGLGPLAKLKGLPQFDRNMGIIALCWVLGLGGLAWLFFGTRARKAELETQIEAAVLDSTRLDAIMKATDSLRHRKDEVARKLAVVQDIDASRYIWAHILDETARALPEHTWLNAISDMPVDSGVKRPKFQVTGRTGNNFALTRYIEQLEASPFIRNVRLLTSDQIREDDKLVYSFLLEADWEEPPVEVIETIPLFDPEDVQTVSDTLAAGESGANPTPTAAAVGQTSPPVSSAPAKTPGKPESTR